MDSIVAAKAKVKHPEESILYGIDFRPELDEGETVTAVVSVVAIPAGDFSITGALPTSATIEDDDGSPIDPGLAIVFRVGVGGTAGKDYRLKAKVTTSEGNTRVGVVVLKIRDGLP